eukprot:352836-Chlamydomonas_euryale.AAC.14
MHGVVRRSSCGGVWWGLAGGRPRLLPVFYALPLAGAFRKSSVLCLTFEKRDDLIAMLGCLLCSQERRMQCLVAELVGDAD